MAVHARRVRPGSARCANRIPTPRGPRAPTAPVAAAGARCARQDRRRPRVNPPRPAARRPWPPTTHRCRKTSATRGRTPRLLRRGRRYASRSVAQGRCAHRRIPVPVAGNRATRSRRGRTRPARPGCARECNAAPHPVARHRVLARQSVRPPHVCSTPARRSPAHVSPRHCPAHASRCFDSRRPLRPCAPARPARQCAASPIPARRCPHCKTGLPPPTPARNAAGRCSGEPARMPRADLPMCRWRRAAGSTRPRPGAHC